ncbi:MAG TPA: hypothetical protein VN841_23350 [Bryobacteraceae bacterium]|nr:hypothetical protein [Bryobacteraceae bacterium]
MRLSRRELFTLGLTLPASMPCWGFAAAEFWNAKPAADWTPDEIQEMITKSPWAKAAAVSFTGGFGGAVAPRMTRGGNVRGGRGTPTAGPPLGDVKQEFKALVRWDSSLPIRDALHLRPSNAIEKFYVLAVTGDLPMIGRRTDDDPAAEDRTVEMLKQYSHLDRKGDPIYLEDALTSPANYPGGPATLFYFSRGDSILPGDKQITFSTKFGPYEIKAKFTLKEMLYHGKLEL